jgi:phosphoribosylaminoimidazole (AIR) synthetase
MLNTYKKASVDIDLNNEFIKRLKKISKNWRFWLIISNYWDEI